jgi:hypothetical protein
MQFRNTGLRLRKFSFSYFRENLFSLFAKKLSKSYENNESFHENFSENFWENVCENEHFREHWRGKRKCRETSEFQEANEV